MSKSVPLLLLLVCFVSASACAQEPTFQVADIPFVRKIASVEEGQKEAVAGDLNGDADPDVLIAVEDHVTILRGDGTGHLDVTGEFPAGPNPAGPALADLDGDGSVDVAVANHETTQLTLLRGTGTGKLEPFSNSPLAIDVDPHPHAVRAADLDGNGSPDLIVDHRAEEGLLLLRGRGDGTFASTGTVVNAGGDPYRGMAVGDLNEDGRVDLVTPNPTSVGLLLSTQESALAYGRHSIDTKAGPFAADLGDLNGDGLLDVIAALDEGSSLVQVFLGDGGGRFREAENSPFRLAAGGKMIAGGDFNGDAAVTGWNASEVLLLLGGADSIRTAALPVEGNAWGPAAADLNGDGIDDLVIPDGESDRVVTFVSRAE